MDGSYEENLSLIDIYVICYTKIYKMIFSQPNLANKFHLLKRKNTCLYKFSNSSHFFFKNWIKHSCKLNSNMYRASPTYVSAVNCWKYIINIQFFLNSYLICSKLFSYFLQRLVLIPAAVMYIQKKPRLLRNTFEVLCLLTITFTTASLEVAGLEWSTYGWVLWGKYIRCYEPCRFIFFISTMKFILMNISLKSN